MLSDEQYEKDAKNFKKAMDGWGTDDELIVELTTKRTNADRQQIIKFYKSSFGEDLFGELSDELGGDLKKVVLGMFRTPVDYDCYELNNAIKGAGTDESVLIEIIATRTNQQLQAIKNRYKELFSIVLEDEVKDECGGDLGRLLISLLQCNRSEENDIDEEKLKKDLAELYEAGEGTWGTDESAFNRIFVNRSRAELNYINNEYQKYCGKNLKEVVENEFSGDTKEALVTILHCLLNPSDYFATRINDACKGCGTKDNQLIRVIISRDEIDLKKIKEIYKLRYGRTLYEEIEDECSGNYKNILIGIAKSD